MKVHSGCGGLIIEGSCQDCGTVQEAATLNGIEIPERAEVAVTDVQRLDRIIKRYRYELRDPAIKPETVDEMTLLLDGFERLRKEQRLALNVLHSLKKAEPQSSEYFMYLDNLHARLCNKKEVCDDCGRE